MTIKSVVFLALYFTGVILLQGCTGTGVESPSTPGEGATSNTIPVADAGSIQHVTRGSLVTLDGSNSIDADGDQLTFRWYFVSKPSGSSAELSNPTAITPTFTADLVGEYTVELIANDDRQNSIPAQVAVTANIGNVRPVANAGRNQSVGLRPDEAGKLVLLDGSTSRDANGDPLTYQWAFSSRPPGSNAALSDSTIARPTFIVDKAGAYEITLQVKDRDLISLPDSVRITGSVINVAPIAHAGEDQAVSPGAEVTLDGNLSHDANPEDVVTYNWSFARPAPAGAELEDPTFPTPKLKTVLFTEPNRVDEYLLALVVSDGRFTSIPDNVLVRATLAPTANAGSDRTMRRGETVTLSGTVTNATRFIWTVEPASDTRLDNTLTLTPTFSTNKEGDYRVTLEAIKETTDGVRLGSHMSTITIKARIPPVADPGLDRSAKVCSTVQVAGNPADMDRYVWRITRPGQTTPTVLAEGRDSSFLADIADKYILTLTVTKDQVDSDPEPVEITASDQGLGHKVYHQDSDVASSGVLPCYTCHKVSDHDQKINDAYNPDPPDLKNKTTADLTHVLTTGKLLRDNSVLHLGGKVTATTADTDVFKCRVRQLSSFLSNSGPEVSGHD